MFGNIFISSAIVLALMFSASAMYNSYNQAQEAKQIQEQYEIIKDIKKLIAKQYNKNPEEITRDEIIALLPKDWSGVLSSKREKLSTTSQIDFLNEDAKIVLDEDEKIKLLALKSKLKNISSNSATLESNKYTFEVGAEDINFVDNNKQIETSVKKAINYLYIKLILENGDKSVIEPKVLNDFTPFNYIYKDFGNKTNTQILEEKKNIFKNLIKKQIESKSNIEERLLEEKNLF